MVVAFRFSGAPQVLRYSVAKEVEAVSGRDVRLEMEVCSDPIPSKTTWDWGSLRVEAGQVSFLIYFCASLRILLFLQTTSRLHNDFLQITNFRFNFKSLLISE